MYEFEYAKPSSLADAVAMLKADAEARPVSGGMTLLPTMKQRLARPSKLIDLNGIKDLRGIKVEAGKVTIGALTRHAEVKASAELAKAIPVLVKMAEVIGDPAVRNRGTIGGSVANNDPTADYPAAVLGLGATVVTDRRRIAADDFFKGMFSTALADGELITAIEFPVPEKAGYMKFRNPASRYAMVGVLVAKGPAGVRVTVTGAGQGGVFRHAAMEAALSANWSPESVAKVPTPSDGMNSDIHGSAEYRAHLVGVMAKRAVAAAG
jgi:carbon-monoxide dehydrogenase medium subunit